jgi:hypothetical protein
MRISKLDIGWFVSAVLVFLLVGITPVFAVDSATETATIKDATGEEDLGMAPPKIALPKYVKRGTPKDIRQRVPNLEADDERDKTRARVRVPKDAVNLASKKEVTGSDEEPIIGDLEMLTDGDKEATDGSFVELGPGIQWVQIDLGSRCKIYAIALWHYHQEIRVYHDVVIRIADDADFITNVATLFNNDHDNSARLGVGKDKPYLEEYKGKLIGLKGVECRFVRLYSNGNTSNGANDYIEVEVYGTPLE